MKIGVIAEQINDVEVLYELTCKLTPENSFSFKKFVGHGCGTLRRKCSAWARILAAKGCSHLVVLHDLDDRRETELRATLEGSLETILSESRVILIPVQEIEAWLLTDAKALKEVFNMRRIPKVPTNPEAVDSPKEKLADIVWREARRRYVNTIHNKKIAAAARVSKVKTCVSFRPYPRFISSSVNG